MNFGSRQTLLKVALLFAVLLPFLTGCWDKTELDQLAIISMLGIDYDPEKDKRIMYYQILNPYSGASSLEPGGPQAPVFTYKIEAPSFGEARTISYEWMSRDLFEPHYRVMIISKRAAEHILRDVANYMEALPRAKASVFVLITEDPMDEIMNNFTLLERIPAEALHARLRFLIKYSLYVNKDIELRDLSERMLQDRVVVLPIIKQLPGRTDRVDEREGSINASIDNIIIQDGAVIKDFRMVGKLSGKDLISYNVLNGATGRHTARVPLNGKEVTLTFQPIRYQREVELKNNRPVITIHIDFMLTALRSTEYLPRNYEDVLALEKGFTQLALKEQNAFYKKYTALGWDVAGVKDALRRYLPDYPIKGDVLKDAEVKFTVHSKFMYPSHIMESY